MKFQGFVGPTYKLDSVNVDCQRCVNLYPEKIESGTGKEGEVAYLKSTPGLEKLFTVGTGPIRMIFADSPDKNSYSPNNRVLVVSGNMLYRCSYVDGAWDTQAVLTDGDTLWSSVGPVYCVARKIGPPPADNSNIPGPGNTPPLPTTTVYTGTEFYIADGSGYTRYAIGYNTESPHEMYEDYGGAETDNTASIAAGVPTPTHVVWIDGFTIINAKNTNRFYISGYENFIFDHLDFASSEGDPDNIVAILAMNRDLWLFNEKSIEIWSNAGNADFPFQRVQGGFIEKGCVAPHSVAKIDGTALWLGRDEHGQGIVFAAKGMNPQRVSTHAVEQAIQSYADSSTARAFTYQSGGHQFYVLNFDEATWVYDLSTGLWHERAYTFEGELERHRAQVCTFVPALNLHLVGDYENGNVYALKDGVYTDDENPITRMRVTPHISAGQKDLFFKSLQIDMQVGVGTASGQGSDPQIMLDWSNDGGNTWSSESWTSLGQNIGGIGEYKKRVIWRRLGMAKDRVFRAKVTDPVKVTMLGAEIEVEGGRN